MGIAFHKVVVIQKSVNRAVLPERRFLHFIPNTVTSALPFGKPLVTKFHLAHAALADAAQVYDDQNV